MLLNKPMLADAHISSLGYLCNNSKKQNQRIYYLAQFDQK